LITDIHVTHPEEKDTMNRPNLTTTLAAATFVAFAVLTNTASTPTVTVRPSSPPSPSLRP